MDKVPCGKEGNKYSWSREATKILIELYEGFPCLYQVNADDYYNKNERTSAFEVITKEFNKRNLTTLTVKTIQDKIHGIRTQFLNEVNKIKKSKVSGAGSDEIYKPKLWCFELLQFIQKGSVVIRGDSNLDTQSTQSSQETYDEFTDEPELRPELIYDGDVQEMDEVILSPLVSSGAVTDDEQVSRTNSRLSDIPPPQKKRKTGKPDKTEKIESLMESAANTLRSLATSEEKEVNRNVVFSQFIAAELNTIEDEEIVDEIKHQITNILFNGKKLYRQKKNQQ